MPSAIFIANDCEEKFLYLGELFSQRDEQFPGNRHCFIQGSCSTIIVVDIAAL
ncbi:MAG: hypothetical protein AAF316_02460 [Cyanobacteria bacterium P01_A01_bin.80]